MNKKSALIIGTVIILGGIGAFYFMKLRKKKKYEHLESIEPTPTKDTPTFNPSPYAKNLYTAMKGWGTDEEMIFKTLSKLKTDSQKNAVMDEFKTKFGEGKSLELWLKDDLSKKDYDKAIGMLST